MSFEPENMGMEWLKENVKEEKYVVMKAEVEVVEEIMRSKKIKWWIRFAWDASQRVLGVRGRNMERDMTENIYQTMHFFFTLSAFFLPFYCWNLF
ncbi:unnamed protein product [Brassica oleracea]